MTMYYIEGVSKKVGADEEKKILLLISGKEKSDS